MSEHEHEKDKPKERKPTEVDGSKEKKRDRDGDDDAPKPPRGPEAGDPDAWWASQPGNVQSKLRRESNAIEAHQPGLTSYPAEGLSLSQWWASRTLIQKRAVRALHET